MWTNQKKNFFCLVLQTSMNEGKIFMFNRLSPFKVPDFSNTPSKKQRR